MSTAEDLSEWQPKPFPDALVLEGKYTRLEKLSVSKHADAGLSDAVLCSDNATRFLYLLENPPANHEEFLTNMGRKEASKDPSFYAIINKATGVVGGYLSLMRIFPEHGVCEIGNVYMGPTITRSRISSEAVYLLLEYAFGLGYRRVEWKCNSLNLRSRSAALRFGFQYEGLFRKHLVIKGLNRDTAWFAMLDDDWNGGLHAAFVSWFDESNFDESGNQIKTLNSFRA